MTRLRSTLLASTALSGPVAELVLDVAAAVALERSKREERKRMFERLRAMAKDGALQVQEGRGG